MATIIRVYSYDGSSGNVHFDLNDQTPEEVALGFNFFDPDYARSRR